MADKKSVSSELTTLAVNLTKQLTSIVSTLVNGDIKDTLAIQTKIQTLTIAVESCKTCAQVIGQLDNIQLFNMLEIYNKLNITKH